jgi:hypothetical protein
LDNGESELISLYGRHSIPHICIIDRINGWDASRLIERFPETQLFAWTKSIMGQYVALDKNYVDTPEGSMSWRLTNIINNICNSKVRAVPCGSPISIDQSVNVRKALWQISKFDYSGTEKERFVIVGFSLLKLFTQSIVPMQQLEKQIARGVIAVRSPLDQLKELNSIANGFVGLLSEYMSIVMEGLSILYSNIEYRNAKFDYLLNCLIESASTDRFTVIVPKDFYSFSFSACFKGKDKFIIKRMYFITSEKFNNESDMGDIICTGAFKSKHFNPFDNVPGNVSILTYSHEEATLNSLAQVIQKSELFYSEKNIVEKLLSLHKIEGTNLHGEIQEDFINEELEVYIRQAIINNAIFTARVSAGSGHNMVSICRIVLFESGQEAFLTKYYIAYSLNETSGKVIEKNVSDLQQGDYLIFKNFGDQAEDIIDELLQKLIVHPNHNTDISKSYDLVKRWKHVLKEYMQSQRLSFRDISKRLNDLGHRKHEVTIRSWLNEETHIVGPRDEDSFVAIALITGDEDISNDPQKYQAACNVIRSTRIKILKYIGTNIINSMNCKCKQTDEFLASVIGDVSEFASLLRIENIVEPMNLNMPINIVNRPQ